MLDEKEVVGVRVRVTADRDKEGYFQRKADAELVEKLGITREGLNFRKALNEMYLAKLLIAPETAIRTMNFEATRGMTVADASSYRIDLERHYKDWQSRMQGWGTSRSIAEDVISGHTVRSIASNKRMSYQKAYRLLRKALAVFVEIRGYDKPTKVKIPPTPHMRVFLDNIDQMTRENSGIPPTFDELAARMKLTKSTIAGLVKRCVERGILSHAPGRARSLVTLV